MATVSSVAIAFPKRGGPCVYCPLPPYNTRNVVHSQRIKKGYRLLPKEEQRFARTLTHESFRGHRPGRNPVPPHTLRDTPMTTVLDFNS